MKKLYVYLISILLFSCSKGKVSPEKQAEESKKANEFFDAKFDEVVDRSPIFQLYLGIKKDNDKWDEFGVEKDKSDLELVKKQLDELISTIKYNNLDDATKVSYDMFKKDLEDDLKYAKFIRYNYLFDQMNGYHQEIPSLLINFHMIDDEKDARAYIKRLNTLPEFFDKLIEANKVREKEGIMTPKFVFAYVIDVCKNLNSGYPIDKSKNDNTLFADFKSKVDTLFSKSQIDKSLRDQLIAEGEKAVKENVTKAYTTLIDYLTEQEKKATDDDGAWKFPNGEEYYKYALENITSTNITPDQVFETGMSEVKRIHSEMEKIKEQVKFSGSLKDFFKFIRTDKQFYYPNTVKGKEDYLKKANDIIANMKTKLDYLFKTKPITDMIVKRVEPYREKTAHKAFYYQPDVALTRPGIYYVNLYDMNEVAAYEMEALAYHEGIPGHHMQIALAMELKDLPKFRKYGNYTAFIEGWGLYSEEIPKEIGLYSDPYSDFGRLAMELFRACRLVVDAGIHYKKWDRKQGIEFYRENTSSTDGDIKSMVERHVVMPGQATAYKIGKIKIMELREKAKKELGDKFDIGEFHDVVLLKGPLPLNILEINVNNWIASKKSI